jgi:ABC-2 type transport system ATP-binding protein
MNKAVEVTDLRKEYGSFQAVKGISFSVEPGEIFALIGPNGAGKSTTLRMLATLLKPSGGSALIGGINVAEHPEKVREIISYLPEEAGAYKSLKGIDYLRFMAGLYASSKQEQEEFVERGKIISGLEDRLKDKISTYSKGMTRKLLLARTVMAKPQLAILDEPTSGLDVVNAIDIRKTIQALAKEGMSVLLSSHNMLEIEYLSDRVGLIANGILHDVGTAAELKKKYKAENLEQVFIMATNA